MHKKSGYFLSCYETKDRRLLIWQKITQVILSKLDLVTQIKKINSIIIT